MKVLWETDSDSQSLVEWGLYVFLSESTSGSSFNNYGNSKIHTVELTGLEPGTRNYYRAVIGDYEDYSDLYSFIENITHESIWKSTFSSLIASSKNDFNTDIAVSEIGFY